LGSDAALIGGWWAVDEGLILSTPLPPKGFPVHEFRIGHFNLWSSGLRLGYCDWAIKKQLAAN